MKKNYFELRNNHRNNGAELEELSTIYTMSAIKRLLGKTYTPYIDALRRTYAQNLRADNLPTILELIAKAEEEREELRAEYKDLGEQLKDITLSDEERAELEEEYYLDEHEIAVLAEELADLKAVSIENYSDLKDLCQQFTLAYISADLTADEYRATLGRLLGVDEPNARQQSNRAEWAQLNGRQKRGAVEHVARVKHGQRAVNRYIRQQANKSADYTAKLTSYNVAMENGANIRALTRSTYAESLADIARIRLIAKHGKLNRTQSAFINHFASKGARAEEQRARTEYHAKHFDNAIKHDNITQFYRQLNNRGYMARRAWAFEQIGVLKGNRQADIMKQIYNKLAPFYRDIIIDGVEERAERRAEEQTHKTAPKRENERVRGIPWVKHTEPPQKTYRPMTEEERAELLQSEPKQSKRNRKPISAWNAQSMEQLDRMEYSALWCRLLAERDNPTPTASARIVGHDAPSTEPVDHTAWTHTRVQLNTATPSADLDRAKACGLYTILAYEPPTE